MATTDRAALLPAMIERAVAMRDLLLGSIETREPPWASMAVDGHGAYWSAAAVYVREHAAAIDRGARLGKAAR